MLTLIYDMAETDSSNAPAAMVAVVTTTVMAPPIVVTVAVGTTIAMALLATRTVRAALVVP